MKTLEEHRKSLKKVADLALSNGLVNSGIDFSKISSFSKLTKNQRKRFVHACHDGYKASQKLIIKEIQEYQTLLAQLKEQLKEARKKKERALVEDILDKTKIISYRIASFSHIADAIAWQLMGQQITTARRFHINEKGSKILTNSNIAHASKVADEINENPDDFALISDITNFVQIGDLLVMHKGSVGVIELKEGVVNDQIAQFLTNLEAQNQTVEDVKLEELFDKATAKQIKRVVRQKARANQMVNLINNDEGVDPSSGSNMKIGTPSVPTEYYYKELIKLQETLKEEEWAYGVVDGCLHIGMYRDKALQMAPFIIQALIESETTNYVLVDWMSISQHLSEPLFVKPLPPDFMIDILTGKVKVIIGLDLDKMINLFTDLGLETSWMTTKETAKFKQKKISDGLVEMKNRGIVMKSPSGAEIIMHGGIISKIIYDNINPRSIALSILSVGYKEEVEDN